jgi:lipopolysaccharide export system permease protein
MILFFYVFRDFFKYVLGTILLCLFLFILFDFIHKTTRYLGAYSPETKNLLKLYIYQIPSLLVQALPIASLLGSVICMVLLSRTNEITAMRAAGMGELRIGAPIAAGGLLLCLVSFVVGELVLPSSARKMHYVQEVLIEKETEQQIAEGARWVRNGSLFYNFRDYDPLSGKMYGVRVLEVGPSFRPKRIVQGVSAYFREETKEWVLEKVLIEYFWPNGTMSYSEERAEYSLVVPVEPKKLKKERRLPNEMSLGELNELIERGRESGVDTASLSVDMHVKLAFHFASLIVCLIGLKFSYKSERTMETAKGILMAIGIGLSYWFILNACRALGRRGIVPPVFAGWTANFVIATISTFEIYRSRKAT